jgi:hypothetical protein
MSWFDLNPEQAEHAEQTFQALAPRPLRLTSAASPKGSPACSPDINDADPGYLTPSAFEQQ